MITRNKSFSPRYTLLGKFWNSIFCLGELKLAQRQISMKDLGAIIESIDANGDGKLTYEEVKAVLKQVGGKVNYTSFWSDILCSNRIIRLQMLNTIVSNIFFRLKKIEKYIKKPKQKHLVNHHRHRVKKMKSQNEAGHFTQNK